MALARHGLPPAALELELTESALLDETTRAADKLDQLRGIGVGVALDDFGTGYSSLSRIVALPISSIKIDHAFVSQIGERGSAIIAAVISLARHLRVSVVAEGVETAEQEAFLRAEGCTLLPGFPTRVRSTRRRWRSCCAAGRSRRPDLAEGGDSKSRPTRSEPQASEGGPLHGWESGFPVRRRKLA